jgi:hypothetical protein
LQPLATLLILDLATTLKIEQGFSKVFVAAAGGNKGLGNGPEDYC